MNNNNLIDQFGRKITYLRLSLTDRCDLRCVYCMSARPTFLPKKELMNLNEMTAIVEGFVRAGIQKIRLSGGEPLVRPDFLAVAKMVAAQPLREWTLTTNATQFPLVAGAVAKLGLRRINVSLDSLNAETFAEITRGGKLEKTLDGIAAAKAEGIQVKINALALAGINDDELSDLIEWAHGQGHDITLIETMPMSDTGMDLTKHYLPLTKVKTQLDAQWHLTPEIERAPSSGPAQFFKVKETGGRIGFITPLSQKFCANCNRIRVSADGKLWTCLGQNHSIDLKAADNLDKAIQNAMHAKPLEHNFAIEKNKIHGSPQRMMAHTGG